MTARARTDKHKEAANQQTSNRFVVTRELVDSKIASIKSARTGDKISPQGLFLNFRFAGFVLDYDAQFLRVFFAVARGVAN